MGTTCAPLEDDLFLFCYGFDIVKFPFPDGDIPRSTSYGVYISQIICFTRVSSFIFLKLFGLLECLVMMMILILVIKF